MQTRETTVVWQRGEHVALREVTASEGVRLELESTPASGLVWEVENISNLKRTSAALAVEGGRQYFEFDLLGERGSVVFSLRNPLDPRCSHRRVAVQVQKD